MTDTSLRVNSYRDEARNRTLYQLVVEVCGMHRSVEFDSTATVFDLKRALQQLVDELGEIVIVGLSVEPQDPWAAARAHWIAQSDGGGWISQDEYVDGRTAANNQLSTLEEMLRRHKAWVDRQQQPAGPHGLRSGDKAA